MLKVLCCSKAKIRLEVLDPKIRSEPMAQNKVHQRYDLRWDHRGVLGGEDNRAQLPATQDGEDGVAKCVWHLSGKIFVGIAAHLRYLSQRHNDWGISCAPITGFTWS